MPISPGGAAMLARLDTAYLGSLIDAGTLRRALPYATESRVRDLDVTETGQGEVTVTASVLGSASAPYVVTVEVHHDRFGPRLDGRCSCPVGRTCKHCVAAVLVAREVVRRPGAVATPWQSALDRALAALEPEWEGAPTVPLGLAVEVAEMSPGHYSARTGPTVSLHPVRRGRQDRWVRGQVGWRDLTHLRTRLRGVSGAQVAALGEVRGLARDRTGYGLTSPDDLALTQVGEGLWSALTRCARAGLPLVPGKGVATVNVVDGDVDALVDVTTDATGGTDATDAARDVLLDVGVRLDGRWRPASRLTPLFTQSDRPAASRTHLTRPEAVHGAVEVGGPLGAREVRLIRFTTPIPGSVWRLADGGALRVPAADRDLLLHQHLPRLSRAVEVVSSDGSMRVPEPPRPRLAVHVDWNGATRAEVSWHWHYRLGETDRSCSISAGRATLDGIRDRAEETALLNGAASAGLLEVLPEDLREPLSANPLPWALVEGDAALRFATEVLPALAGLTWTDRGDVETGRLVGIEVHQTESPDFRRAEGEVVLRFEATDPRADDDTSEIDWLDLSVVVEVDGEKIPLPLVLEALTLGWEHVVAPSGLLLPADHPALEQLRRLVEGAREVSERGRETRTDADDGVIRLRTGDLGLWATLGELADLGDLEVPEEMVAWAERALALRDLTTLPDVEPVGLASLLRPYQRDGLRWLAFLADHGLGGILADDMGLGKTLQTLALVVPAREAGAAPYLVVAPTSVTANWAKEAARHTPGLKVEVVSASAKRRAESIADLHGRADVVVTTYTLLRLEAEQYAALHWGGLLLDEAQHIKNHASKTHHAVRRIPADVRFAITGTPMENRLMELWSLLAIVAPGLYPTAQMFRDLVVGPVEREADAEALARLHQRIRPFFLRRTKDLVAADLPEKQEQVLTVDLGPAHRRVYDTHLARERQQVLGLVDDLDRNRVAVLAAITRLRQLSLDPALVDAAHERLEVAKTDVVVDQLLEVVAEGHRALVFSTFPSYLRRVRARLEQEGLGFAYLDGRTRKREEAIERFRSGEAPVFLISLKAGGVGLTLTEADYVYVLDPWWNPAAENQAIDRAHRIGQTRSVMVYRLVSADTIEEKVMALKERKAALFDSVVDAEGAVFGSVVTADEVRGLFS